MEKDNSNENEINKAIKSNTLSLIDEFKKDILNQFQTQLYPENFTKIEGIINRNFSKLTNIQDANKVLGFYQNVLSIIYYLDNSTNFDHTMEKINDILIKLNSKEKELVRKIVLVCSNNNGSEFYKATSKDKLNNKELDLIKKANSKNRKLSNKYNSTYKEPSDLQSDKQILYSKNKYTIGKKARKRF